ncbi:F-box protein At3g62430-like isoform X2 [Rutidosis leptorrhynchoides]|uniref:F-box protein At3g62430-like isoform X2 n=1 Tax=Rutidosis leptorrhynchoides TaxID=125765 RepID=UPI003A99D88B
MACLSKSCTFNALAVAIIIVLMIGFVLFLRVKLKKLSTGVALVIPKVGIPFPCLKKLNLQFTQHHYKHSLTKLISRCPVLEELCLDRPGLTCKSRIIKLRSRSMRRLTIERCEFKDQKLVIDAPKLEYFHFFACYFRKYTLKSTTSLVEAYISKARYHSIVKLLRCVSFTKILTLTRESLMALGTMWGITLPMFPNLVKLEVPWLETLLLILLQNMPNLEYLTFSDEYLPFIMGYNIPNGGGTCLSSF